MTALLLAFLAALVLPFVMATWRTSLAALSLQALLMGWMVLRRETLAAPEAAFALVDLVLLRGLVAPFMLYQVMRDQKAPKRGDVIPPNMLSWTLVGALVAVAFQFAGRLYPESSQARTLLAVPVAGLLLGLFVLATQTGVFTQTIGALRIENAIALFELSQEGAGSPLPIKIGLAAVFLLTACLYALYVRWLRPSSAMAGAALDVEEPVL